MISLLLLLVSATAYADPMDATLNSVPAFSSMAGDPKYKNAADKAQEAFLIQTGVTQSVDKTKVVITKIADEKASKAINENTPFRAKDVYFVAGTSYALLVKKQVTQKFKNPIFPSVTHVVTVGKGSGSLGLSLPF